MTVVDASIVVRLLSARKADDLLRQRFAGSDRLWHAPAHLDIEVYSAAEILRQPLLTCDAKFARAPSNSHAAEVHTFPE